jgi:preprotein translocase subunit SecG
MALLSILIIIISVLLVLVVIIQNSKGGGLDANIASQNQSFGAKKNN